MPEISNVYIERIAAAARDRLVTANVITPHTREYTQEIIERIVQFFGGEIQFDKSAMIQDGQYENEQIYIKKTAEDKFKIYSRSSKDPQDLFMKVFHELGHAFLDFPSSSVGQIDFCDGRRATDVQAELFARAFIMPSTDFIESAKQCIVAGAFDIQAIADIYHVRYVDALIRGKELNFWE